jgi:alpha-L-fucosidase 2
VYPGDEINWRDTPELLEAARCSLRLRMEHGAGNGGWPLAWFISQAARQGDAALSGTLIDRMVTNTGTRNFFNGAGVFQIDGNLGATAGIAEALLQSHTGMLEFLPALPPAWKNGSVKSLRARGGHTVDMSWVDGRLVEAIIYAGKDGLLCCRGTAAELTCDGQSVAVEAVPHGFRFPVVAGNRYVISSKPPVMV